MVSWSDLRVLQKEWGWASRRKRAINRYIDESFGDTDLIDAEISTKRRRLEDFLSGSPETRVNLDGETVVQFDDGASDGSVTLLGSESGNDEDSDFSHRSILSEAHTFLGSAPNCNSERARVNLSEDPFDQGALCDPTCDNLSKRLCGRRVNDKDARVLPNKPCGPNHGWTKQFEAECDRSCTNQIFFNLEKRRGTAGAEISSDSWTAAECDLISRLSMRGFEPLLPSGWRLDFPTFPSPLFSSGTKKPLIRSLKGRDFHAIKALKELTSIGPRVRDCPLSNIRPEPTMERLLESYIHWALRDADLQNRTRMIPTYVVKARCKNASTDSTVQSIVRGLIGLANRYRRVWRQRCSGEPASEDTSSFAGQRRERFDDSRFPILTGFLICGPALGIITLDSNPVKTPVLDPESSARLIAQFNFSEPSQDVWNALAVAIVVIQVRKMILQVLQENAEGLMWETDGSNTKTGVDEDA